MLSDSKYLKMLKIISPKFLETYNQFNTRTSNILTLIRNNIRNKIDRHNLYNLVLNLKSRTNRSNNLLSSVFLKHFENHKNNFQKNAFNYENEINKLGLLKTQKYRKAMAILKSFLRGYRLSQREKKRFDLLGKILFEIFNKKEINRPNICSTNLLIHKLENNYY